MVKIWIDDVRPAPTGYVHVVSVNQAKKMIQNLEKLYAATHKPEYQIEILDMDHDAGDFVSQGGDYVRLLDWLERSNRNYPIRIHSMNPIGVANMRAIIQHNGWTEVLN